MATLDKIEIQQKSDEVVVVITPFINEDSEFPHLSSQKKIVVDFSKLEHINSYGIKKWCQWVDQHKKVNSIILDHCPYILTRSFSIVVGMITPNMRVRSLYVPYISEKTSERKDLLFKFGEHYDETGFKTAAYAEDSVGQPMVIDVLRDKYFGFLRK